MVKKEKHIKPGYHLTEVGIIPVDWEVKNLGELFDFKNGLNKEKGAFGYGTPIVNYMDVYGKRGLTVSDIKGKVSLNNDELKNYEARKGDVFFTRTSETVQEIGYSSVLMEDIEKATFSGFVLRGRPKNNELFGAYEQYCFSTQLVRKDIISSSTYTTRALTNGRSLSKVRILVPSKPEQSAIAQVLSDTDTLIASLDALIAKKKAIKQGAMQELLTGKRRIPGFSGKWEERKLGDIIDIKTGKKDVNEGNPRGKYPFFTCSRDHTHSDSYSFDGKAILIAGNGEVGNLHYYDGKFEAYQRTYVLQNFGIDIGYLWHQLNSNFKKSLGIGTIGSSIPYIKMENIAGFIFRAPTAPEEQSAIAQVLSDMDSEISDLEAKRDKYKSIKHGMMSELLTGNIRLLGIN